MQSFTLLQTHSASIGCQNFTTPFFAKIMQIFTKPMLISTKFMLEFRVFLPVTAQFARHESCYYIFVCKFKTKMQVGTLKLHRKYS